MNVSKDKTNSNVRRVKGMERILDATWWESGKPLCAIRIYRVHARSGICNDAALYLWIQGMGI